MNMIRARSTLFGATLLLGAAAAFGQEGAYPSKPVTLIVPVAAGSSTDTFARFFAEHWPSSSAKPSSSSPFRAPADPWASRG